MTKSIEVTAWVDPSKLSLRTYSASGEYIGAVTSQLHDKDYPPSGMSGAVVVIRRDVLAGLIEW